MKALPFLSPSGMTVVQYFDALSLESESPWAFGKLNDPTKWQEHAVAFIRAWPYNMRTLPDPYQFTDWREWAMRTSPMLETR